LNLKFKTRKARISVSGSWRERIPNFVWK
jgi:hypothetical protein